MTENALPPTTLIVCTRDRPRLLHDTLASILAADDVPKEIVVVDQSTEPQLDLAGLSSDGCDVRVVASSIHGLGQARNDGVAAASHDVLVFVDDDMLADPKWLRELVGALVGAGPKTVVTGAVEATRGESWRGFTPATQAHPRGAVFEGRLGRDVLAGGHMAIERSAIEDVGGFDPRFGSGAAYPAADDNDLGFRLLELGYRIAYVADAILYHRAWRSGWRYPIAARALALRPWQRRLLCKARTGGRRLHARARAARPRCAGPPLPALGAAAADARRRRSRVRRRRACRLGPVVAS